VELRDRLYPEGGTGLPTLLGVVVVALALAVMLATLRELVPKKIARE